MPQPLTRRELRRRQLEEEAKLEAIATGELPLLDDDGNPVVAEAYAAGATQAPDGQVTDEEPGSRPPAAGRRLPEQGDPGSGGGSGVERTESGSATESAESAPDADTTASDGGTEAVRSPGGTSAAEASTDEEPVVDEPVAGRRAAEAEAPARDIAADDDTTGDAGTADSNAPAPPTPVAGAAKLPSRRSMRERARQADAGAAEPEAPSERTGTGRRPVVRTPRTASGIRSVDSTGALTAVQPVSRHEPEPAPEPDEAETTTDPGAWSAVVSPPEAPATPSSVGPPPAPEPEGDADSTSEGDAGAASTADVEDGNEGATGDTVAGSTSHSAESTRTVPGWLTTPAATSADTSSADERTLTGPEAVAAAALSADEESDETGGSDAPRWSPLSDYSPDSAETPAQPERRSVRERMGDVPDSRDDADAARAADSAGEADAESSATGTSYGSTEGSRRLSADDEERTGARNPATSVIRIVALVLAAIVIGILIALLYLNQGDDGAAGRSALSTVAAASSGWTGTTT
ncbi:hypothetical protein GCM10023169_33800 [Georgenia halophila]|uniref:Uncharacterized protein n=1 Tax=Georgenia halophila TaxID=620889 RepID=A0ABP8LJV1_9MICO